MERKQKAVQEIAKAGFEVKQLVLADKVSNLRSIYADYQEIGDQLWERFNAGKSDQCIYYSAVLDVMEELQYDENTRDAYWEATELFKDIFVKYYIDPKAGRIWQVCNDGTSVFTKETLDWQPTDEPVSPDAIEETRAIAETLEDSWRAARK